MLSKSKKQCLADRYNIAILHYPYRLYIRCNILYGRPGPRPSTAGCQYPWLVKLGLVEPVKAEPQHNLGFDMETTTEKH